MSKNDHTYLSLGTISEGFYREKGSKFYALACPVIDENDVKQQLDRRRRQYHDARHHCYAFIFKPSKGQEPYSRANDDGEPSHSAGDPILGQLRSVGVYDALIIVSRYFGGTKLGVSGLVNAYRTAAADAIQHNQVIQRVYQVVLRFHFDYSVTSEVQRLLHHYDVNIVDQRFEQDCYYQLLVPLDQYEALQRRLATLPGVNLL